MEPPQIFLDEFREEVENLNALRNSVITMKNQIDETISKLLINISINSDGSIDISDIPEATSEKTSTGHYKLNHHLGYSPHITFLSIVNPEDELTSYQITSVNEEFISIITFDWAYGTPIDVYKIFIQIKRN